jgi:hypothetical protein
MNGETGLFELGMALEFFPGIGRQWRLTIDGFPERFGAGGVADALEPFFVQGVGNQFERVGGDGGLFLFTGGMPCADEKSGEQERDAEHRAARISGKGTGSGGIEVAEEIGEERRGPHGGIFGGREGVEQNGVRGGEGRVGVAQERRKIAEMKLPGDVARAIGEFYAVMAEEILHGGFVAGEIAEGRGVFERELKGGKRVVETGDTQRALGVLCRTEDGEDVGGRAKADIPDDELTDVGGEAFGETQLFYIEGFGFGDGSDDGMKGFPLGDGMDAVNATGEFDDFILERHGRLMMLGRRLESKPRMWT